MRKKGFRILVVLTLGWAIVSTFSVSPLHAEGQSGEKFIIDLLKLAVVSPASAENIKTFTRNLKKLYGPKILRIKVRNNRKIEIFLFSTVTTKEILKVGRNAGISLKVIERKEIGEERM